MKKTLLIGLALGLVTLATATSYAEDNRDNAAKSGPLPAQGDAGWTSTGAQKNWGGAGIIGSSHDMTNVAGRIVADGGTAVAHDEGALATIDNAGAGSDVQGRICVYCHHPHNAVTASATSGDGTGVSAPSYSPLWNRRANAARTYQGYNNGAMMSNSATTSTDKRHVLNAAEEGGGTKIAGVSLLCMSCHDGVTAMDAYSATNPSGATGSNDNSGNESQGAIITSATSSFEGDMNNHHPMGFNYRAVQGIDQEIAHVDTIMVPATGVQIKDLLYGAGITATMECVTCHDVHNTANQPGAERFLWRSDNNSNFCLTCHLK